MGKTSKAIGKKLIRLRDFIYRVAMLLFQLSLFLIIVYRIVPVPITPLPMVRLFEQMVGPDEMRLRKDWEPIEDIGRNMCLAAITSEDPKFLSHNGFDFEQIWDAISKSFSRGKRPRGASTITQQTAKNLFFTPQRSWVRKVLEIYVTVALEVFWTKKRILEVYLNIIEMGNGVYGAEAASWYFYGKPAKRLKASEAASIVACFPNPRRWKANRPSRYIKRKQALITRFMFQIGDLPWEESNRSVKMR